MYKLHKILCRCNSFSTIVAKNGNKIYKQQIIQSSTEHLSWCVFCYLVIATSWSISFVFSFFLFLQFYSSGRWRILFYLSKHADVPNFLTNKVFSILKRSSFLIIHFLRHRESTEAFNWIHSCRRSTISFHQNALYALIFFFIRGILLLLFYSTLFHRVVYPVHKQSHILEKISTHTHECHLVCLQFNI